MIAINPNIEKRWCLDVSVCTFCHSLTHFLSSFALLHQRPFARAFGVIRFKVHGRRTFFFLYFFLFVPFNGGRKLNCFPVYIYLSHCQPFDVIGASAWFLFSFSSISCSVADVYVSVRVPIYLYGMLIAMGRWAPCIAIFLATQFAWSCGRAMHFSTHALAKHTQTRIHSHTRTHPHKNHTFSSQIAI